MKLHYSFDPLFPSGKPFLRHLTGGFVIGWYVGIFFQKFVYSFELDMVSPFPVSNSILL